MSLLDAFLDDCSKPDPAYSPIPIWWWSGEPLKIDRLCWQIDQMIAMGIHNVVILNLAPSGPLFGSVADDPPFLSEAWWTIFSAVCDHAADVGMRMFFYDQIGFSGANFQAQLVAQEPSYSGQTLGSVSADGVGRLAVKCPGDTIPLGAYVFPADAPRAIEYVPVTNGVASIEVNIPSALRLAYVIRQGFDYFSSAACAKLIDTVHGEFARRVPKHMGSTIVGSFQDELPNLPRWGDGFSASFASAFGYRLEPIIHALFEEGGEREAQIRLDFHRHRADLAEAAFFKPLFEWHEKSKLICGFDQQGPARAGAAVACVQKYADYMQTHRWFAAPGSDHHGHAKIHSSLAFLYGRPRVWIEGFHSTGWGGTIEETFDWLIPWLRAGATLYNPHAVYYSTENGWWEWAPPSTCWRQPYARHYKTFADAVSRLCKMLSSGTHVAEVGILFPTTTVQSAVGVKGAFDVAKEAERVVNAAVGSMVWFEMSEGSLDKAALDYHLLDEPSVACAEVVASALRINGIDFRTIVLPAVTKLPDATRARLNDFVRSGGRLIEIGGKALVEGSKRIGDVDELAAALAEHRPSVVAPVPTLHRKVGGLNILFVPAAHPMASDVATEGWKLVTKAKLDRSRYRKTATLRLPGRVWHVERFDAFTAERRSIATRFESGQSIVEVDFEGAPCTVLLWEDGAAADPNRPSLRKTETRSLFELPAEGWEAEYVGPATNPHFDVADPARPELLEPHTWRMRCTAEDEKSAGLDAFTTFGTYGWTTGPAEPQALPAPLRDASHYPPTGWTPANYSLEFGIRHDPIHGTTLGPKGNVPQEFLDFGTVKISQAVQFCTSFVSDAARDVVLALGASGLKSIWLNGKSLADRAGGYECYAPVSLIAGLNTLEMRLESERESAPLRANWCLVHPGAVSLFRRAQRLVPPDACRAGSRLRYTGRFTTASRAKSARMQIAVAGVARIYLDGQFIGRQGGFDPYGMALRTQPYDLPALAAGEHTLMIEVTDPGRSSSLLVDMRIELSDGRPMTWTTDEQWTVTRDDEPERPAALTSESNIDPGFLHLHRRPHPLPKAAWAEGPQPNVVVDVTPLPLGAGRRQQRFEWTTPPGAKRMRVALSSGCRVVELSVDGTSIASPVGEVDLTRDEAPTGSLKVELLVDSDQLGGGVYTAPVAYTLGRAVMSLRSWHEQGLGGFSGAIRLSKTFDLTQVPASLSLDLGDVRGTVEAALNNVPVGQRVIAPFRFDLTGAAKIGGNRLELLVTNTLGPFMSVWSPTYLVAPEQIHSGVYGPVQLMH